MAATRRSPDVTTAPRDSFRTHAPHRAVTPRTHGTLSWPARLAWSVAGFGAAVLTGVAYVAWLKHAGNWTQGLGWERTFLLELDHRMPRAIDLVFLVVPWFGTNLTVLPILLACAFWLAVRARRALLAAHLAVVGIGSLALNAVLKDLFGRPRPELWAHRGQYKWSAFPSGHAIIGVSVFVTIAIVLHRERGWRWPYAVAAILLVVNNYSRLYLGVHWPTDVLGGLLIGAVWLAATLHAFRPPDGETIRTPARDVPDARAGTNRARR